ncbi:glycosyltransferase family 39 protein [Altererythrobacter sp. MTPC7]|uniref:glycosyltransferase family 39 protein n=1 Tax=Altererythrobacter sp. MTPC7 TaxID=3056567 RepID=UPI0036F40129
MAPATHEKDPLGPILAICAIFLCGVLWRITTPSQLYFDEIHYVPAARILLDLEGWPNAEHPPLGKLIIAASIAVFGDTPLGWRLPSAVTGTIALFAFARALWFASERRAATIGYALLLASGFHLFVHARIAMLDGLFIAFLGLALWQAAGAVREPETGRWRLALCGIAVGAALAVKWTMIPFAPLFGLTFLAARWSAGRRRLLMSRRGAPVPGITLAEATLWLGAVPLLVYCASFAPALLVSPSPFAETSLPGLQHTMLDLQQSVKAPHTYQSMWADWVLNWRAIWYLYEGVDGAQRGVMLIGNPLTMLIALPALAWCAWAGLVKRRMDALAVLVLYAAALGFWIVAAKPTQFYYHYFAASCFLLAALALALDALWQRGLRWPMIGTVGASLALFAFYYPILSAAPLDNIRSFEKWSWLESWT